jgi:hypothetical protein
MRIRSVLLSSAVLVAASAFAQQSKLAKPAIGAEGGDPDDRASARVLYWNEKTNSSAGWFAFNYGRPVWQKKYEDPAQFDRMTKGKVWRMGSNYWTVLDTTLPLNIAGKRVRAGSYFLGLRRSADGGTWSLAFIDQATVRRTHIDAFQIAKAPVEFEAPMSVAKSDGLAQKLTITLSYPKDDIKSVTMKVAWGNLALTTPIKVSVPE